VLRWLILALAIPAAVFVLACVVERRLLFPAPRLAQEPALDARAQRIWLEAPGVRSEAVLLAPDPPPARPGPLVLYAHGNGELIDQWLGEFAELRASGLSILLVEYPGYGRSSGAPSQASITRAMVAAYDWAVAQPTIDRGRMIGYGRSLGGGAVCALARERPLAALVLESTFTSVRSLAASLFGVPGFLVRDPFDNLGSVRAFAGPILVLHGERDEVVPVEHARLLHEAAPGCQLYLAPCGHNDCARPWAAIQGFLVGRQLL